MQQPQTKTGVAGLLESLGNIYVESLRARLPNNGNSPGDYQHVQTGVDSNGDAIIAKNQLIAGVSNRALLLGAAAVLSVGAMTAALIFDD